MCARDDAAKEGRGCGQCGVSSRNRVVFLMASFFGRRGRLEFERRSWFVGLGWSVLVVQMFRDMK